MENITGIEYHRMVIRRFTDVITRALSTMYYHEIDIFHDQKEIFRNVLNQNHQYKMVYHLLSAIEEHDDIKFINSYTQLCLYVQEITKNTYDKNTLSFFEDKNYPGVPQEEMENTITYKIISYVVMGPVSLRETVKIAHTGAAA